MLTPSLSGNSESVEGGETRAPPFRTGVSCCSPIEARLSPIQRGGYIGVSVSTSSLIAHALTYHGTDFAHVEVEVLVG